MRFIKIFLILFVVAFLMGASSVLAVPAVPASICKIKAEIKNVEQKQALRLFDNQTFNYYAAQISVLEISTIKESDNIKCDSAYADQIEKEVIVPTGLSAGQTVSAQVTYGGDENLHGYMLSNVVELSADDSDSEVDKNSQTGILNVLLNQLFYQEGSATTILPEIKDPAKVEDFTLDLSGKVKVVFKEPIDLSKDEAVKFITNIADYFAFDYLYFKVSPELMSYFKVPLEITFHDLPYVWEPDILKDDSSVLTKDDLENYRFGISDNRVQVSFITRQAGVYSVIPRLQLYIEDNKKISKAENGVIFSGRTSDPAAVLKISLNGTEINGLDIKIDPKTGEFNFPLDLAEGVNLIESRIETPSGQIIRSSKIVMYEPMAGGQSGANNNLFNLSYYVVIGLAVIALFLIIAIVYLVKRKKK